MNVAVDSVIGEFRTLNEKLFGKVDITVRHGSSPFLGRGNLTAVQLTEGIARVSPRLEWSAAVNNDTRGMVVQLVGIDPRTDFDYSSFTISGSSRIDGVSVVISEELSKELGKGSGSFVSVTSGKLDGPTFAKWYNLRVIGVFHQGPRAGKFILMQLEKVEEISGLRNKASSIVAAVEDPARAAKIRDAIKKTLGSDFDVRAVKAEANAEAGNLENFSLPLTFASSVSVVGAVFLVFNTMYMSVGERVHEIGVLRAIGASRRQIFWLFLTEGMAMGILGIFVGILVGLLAARFFISLIQGTFLALQTIQVKALETTETLSVGYGVILLGVASGLASLLGGALYPSLLASKTTIIQAVRPMVTKEVLRRTVGLRILAGLAVISIGLGLIFVFPAFTPRGPAFNILLGTFAVAIGAVMTGANLLSRVSRACEALLTPIMGNMAIISARNLRRKALRNSLTFGIISISLTFIILLGGFQSGFELGFEDFVKKQFSAEIILVTDQRLGIPASLASDFSRLPGVNSVAALATLKTGAKAFGTKGDVHIGLIAADPRVMGKIFKFEFNSTRSQEEIMGTIASNRESLVLSRFMAEALGVREGDTIGLSTIAPYRRSSYRVAGVWTISGLPPQTNAWGSAIISFESAKLHFAHDGMAEFFYVDLQPREELRAREYLNLYASLYPQYGFKDKSTTTEEALKSFKLSFGRIFSVFSTVFDFSILVGTVGVAVTMIVNIIERKKEIGVLRSQGMRSRQLFAMLMGEALAISFMGFLVGVPSGLVLVWAFASIPGSFFPPVIPFASIVQAFGFAIAAAVGGTIYPAYRASRLSVVEAIRGR